MLYGIVDIGSNTVRLNVYHCKKNDINLIFSKKENLGLVFFIKKGKLSAKGLEKLLTFLKKIKKDLHILKIHHYRFFSTAVLRNIENRAEVMDLIKKEVGLEIDLLSGEEEGELSFLGSISSLNNNQGILIDLGGGSVEIVLFKHKKIIKNCSIPIGSLKMYKEYVSGILPDKTESNLIKERTILELEKTGINHQKAHFMCGVGGSIRTIEKILRDLHLQHKKDDLIDVKLLKKLHKQLSPDDKKSHDKILKIKPSRIHTLVPALIILETITSYFGCEVIQTSKNSVREGYLFKKILNR
ncbi:phosphatase [Methanobacterium alkalithermotolerans]|uniref:Phosphatase n=1 Tax=Methanobacterium alkalithermotolerans TaxID=2731220 RepID=A0A8T8KEH2_9EURY|nr:phosphatase [Methanobacterium alkalithermotolerans]QUH23731.1 phosphatase [Methanobacterium alkalithermotolerans]